MVWVQLAWDVSRYMWLALVNTVINLRGICRLAEEILIPQEGPAPCSYLVNKLI